MLTASVLKSRHLALVLITLLGLSSGVAARASVPPGYARAAQALDTMAHYLGRGMRFGAVRVAAGDRS